MFWNSCAFRYERLEELPSALQAGGFRVVSRREKADTVFFECVSADGVTMLFWVTPETEQAPASFCWGSSRDGLVSGPAKAAVEPMVRRLESEGFFSGGAEERGLNSP